jgi:hypothetical protein
VAERRITAILGTLVSTDVPHLYTATTSEGGECRWATYWRWAETEERGVQQKPISSPTRPTPLRRTPLHRTLVTR